MEIEIQKNNDAKLEEIRKSEDSLKLLNPHVSPVTSCKSLIAKGVSLNVQELDLVNKPTCRICFEGSSQGRLLKPCKCKGSIGFVHRHCLETWLSSTNYVACELCHFRYSTIRIPKSCWRWFKDKEASRLLISDSICFAIFTPLVLDTCIHAVSYYEEDRGGLAGFAIIISVCVFILIPYLVWVITCAKELHFCWRRWRALNYSVRVTDRDPDHDDSTHLVDIDGTSRSATVPIRHHPDPLQPWSDRRSRSLNFASRSRLGTPVWTSYSHLLTSYELDPFHDDQSSSE